MTNQLDAPWWGTTWKAVQEQRPNNIHAESPSAQLRWAVFRLLEAVSEWRSASPAGELSPAAPASPQRAIWVYASTIGELNAVEPFLRQLIDARPHLRLVLISNHAHYRDPYLAQYPDGLFYFTLGASRDARWLGAKLPPELLVIAEIPCWPSDAPCRFSYAFLRAAKKRGAKTAIVNGWLYGDQPGCRLDVAEHRLLTKPFLRLIDIACVQTDEVAQQLIRQGLPGDRVAVTGNMKFDKLAHATSDSVLMMRSKLLQHLVEAPRPVIVAGCLRKREEQQSVIEAFAKLRQESPDTLLVLAHRHPEVPQNLIDLEHDLEHHGIRHARRSTVGEAAVPKQTQCLILDTVGELKHFYAAGTVTHVGADHNLLEPLAFRKPVTTSSDWQPNFPNRPIFELLAASGAVKVADNPDDLARIWSDWLGNHDELERHTERIDEALTAFSGVSDSVLQRVLQ